MLIHISHHLLYEAIYEKMLDIVCFSISPSQVKKRWWILIKLILFKPYNIPTDEHFMRRRWTSFAESFVHSAMTIMGMVRSSEGRLQKSTSPFSNKAVNSDSQICNSLILSQLTRYP